MAVLDFATGRVRLQRLGAELCPAASDLAMRAVEAGDWAVDDPNVYCSRCGAGVGPSAALPGGCLFCIDQPLPWRRFVRLGAYQGPIVDWLRAMKFAGQWSWAHWFGVLLAQAAPNLETVRPDRTVVCPVPMHWRRRCWRGHNQSQLMARALADCKRWPMASLLRRRRSAPPQTQLPRSKRWDNVRRCFVARPIDLTGWDVWLVDDIKTTGATLRTCARQLKQQGAHQIHIAVAAVADPLGRHVQTQS